ncbi:MAG TPA: sigma-70 family RNA polymerase sigma factor [Polyangiaceae bacterium]|jgi:RNA polymerase sigma-70 factor (ECF subfamily)|nr:sigma-70 family RNA polymerase sigma factor [Polyangiaceae bacterium]
MSYPISAEIEAVSFTDEQSLLNGLLADDPRAWTEFDRKYSRLIERCIARVLNRFGSVIHSEDTREVYATLFLQLVARDKLKLRSYDSSRGTRLGTWLGMLATHAAYDLLRRRRRDPKSDDGLPEEALSSDSPSPFDACATREQARLLDELLNGFSEKDRQFVTLYFEEGLEPEQVARVMGISVKTVYSKKHKIRCRLAGLIGRQALAA